jgi:hypothetical protein
MAPKGSRYVAPDSPDPWCPRCPWCGRKNQDMGQAGPDTDEICYKCLFSKAILGKGLQEVREEQLRSVLVVRDGDYFVFDGCIEKVASFIGHVAARIGPPKPERSIPEPIHRELGRGSSSTSVQPQPIGRNPLNRSSTGPNANHMRFLMRSIATAGFSEAENPVPDESIVCVDGRIPTALSGSHARMFLTDSRIMGGYCSTGFHRSDTVARTMQAMMSSMTDDEVHDRSTRAAWDQQPDQEMPDDEQAEEDQPDELD